MYALEYTYPMDDAEAVELASRWTLVRTADNTGMLVVAGPDTAGIRCTDEELAELGRLIATRRWWRLAWIEWASKLPMVDFRLTPFSCRVEVEKCNNT